MERALLKWLVRIFPLGVFFLSVPSAYSSQSRWGAQSVGGCGHCAPSVSVLQPFVYVGKA